MTTSKLSSKGQIVIPKAIRDRRHWTPGVTLVFEERDDGVLLRPAQAAPPMTTLDELSGCLPWDGPPRTLEDMDAAIAAGVREASR